MQKQNKNSSKKKPKRQARAQQMIASQMDHTYMLGHCAQKYALSLADPFSGPADACMPVTPAVMSRKARFFIRTQLTTSTTSGDGFVTMQPFAGNNGATTAGNVGTAAAYTSSGAYVGGGGAAIPQLDPATTGVIANNHNGDYPVSAFTSLYSRLVSMGFRIRYAGTELNRGGRIILLENPEHTTMANTTLVNLLADEKAKEHKIGENWVTLCSTGPTVPNEYDYIAGPYLPYGAPVQYAHYLCAYIRSAALGQVFDVEFYWNFEFTGSVARGKTQSEADDAGTGVVLGAIKSLNDNQLDSKHPLVQVSSSSQRSVGGTPAQAAQALNGMVQRYAAKNASGWFSKAVKGVTSFAKNAEHYIEKGAQFAGAAAPLLALL
jgi:hypothetical protein